MDSIEGTPESIEGKDEFAASIVTRDESLVGLATTPGLGPPDLCWLQKASKGSWATVNAEPRGFWHHTLGRDVSSSAAVAAYFAELNATVEPITFMQGLWYTAETKIERGFYCCYEPFNRLDVRCELCIPGGVVCGALDAEGTVHQVTPDIWRNCQLAAFLRHQLYDPELTQHAGTLRRFNPLPTAEAEQRLFDIVDEMYSTKMLPRALEYITQDAGLGSTAEHMDIVLFTVFHYLGRQHRWKVALAFFERLSKVYVGASLYVAAAQRELEGFDDSFATLSSALERTPSDAALLVALANECLYAQQLEMAVKLARRAIRLQQSLRPAWLLLARCYVRMGLYTLSIITLNVTPPPPLPVPEQEMLFGVPPPTPHAVTKVHVQLYDAEQAIAKQMSTEEASAGGSRALQGLPGAVLVNREPLDLGVWPDLGPLRSTRAVLSASYGILQELVAAVGWDSFLQMRARVFVMHERTGGKKKTDMEQGIELADGGSAYDAVIEKLADAGMSDYHLEHSTAKHAVELQTLALESVPSGSPRTKQDASAPTTARSAALLEGRHSSDGTSPHPANHSMQEAPQEAVSDASHNRGTGIKQASEEAEGTAGLRSPAEPVERQSAGGGALTAAASILMPFTAPNSLWSAVFGSKPRPNSASSTQPAGPVAEAMLPSSQSFSEGHSSTASGKTAKPWRALLRSARVQLTQRAHRPAHCTATQDEVCLWHSPLRTDQGQPLGEARSSKPDDNGRSPEDADEEEEEEGLGDRAYEWQAQQAAASLQAVAGQRQNWQHELLSSIQEDQAWALQGVAPEEDEEQESKQHARRLCVRSLDELIIALWHDLQAYMEWKAQDAELVRVRGRTLAELVLGTPSDPDAPGAGDAAATPLPQLSAVDWMRRGQLAERLYHDAEALSSYQCCIKLGGFNAVSSTAVMRLAAHAGDVKQALEGALRLLAWHASQLPANKLSTRLGPSLCRCASVMACCGHLAAQQGAQQLAAVLQELQATEPSLASTLGGDPTHVKTAVAMLNQALAKQTSSQS